MSEYPFNLQGSQEHIWGTGQKDGNIEESHEFYLRQGVVIVQIEHHGHDDFQLSFIHVEANAETKQSVAKKMNRTAVRLGNWMTRGKLQVEGTEEYEDYLMGIWKIENREKNSGKFKGAVIKQVKEDDILSLRPGKYRLEMTSKDRWSCHLIQPDLGQSSDNIVSEVDENYDFNEDGVNAGRYLLGPLKSGSRPVLAHIRHSGRGEFYAAAHSVDGTHQCLIFLQEGQFLVEDQPTEIRPGKEYFFYIEADGEWMLAYTEAY